LLTTRDMSTCEPRPLKPRERLTLLAALPAIALLGLTANAHDVRAPPAAKTIRAHFSCADSKLVDATFINGTRSSVKLALSDGRKLSLPQARSGSGARYATKDESVVFWNKGDTAFLEEAGKTTYAGCVASKLNAK
jgi:membrane-bound inhibitor of C-type lysozyme